MWNHIRKFITGIEQKPERLNLERIKWKQLVNRLVNILVC